MAHDVFISYSHKDKPVAFAVCAALEQARVRCWIAPRDVATGQKYGGDIVDAIERSRVMAVVFSSSANSSEHVVREVELAVKKGTAILPFRIEDVEPSGSMEYLLSTTHWLDALTPPLERHIDKLVRDVARFLGHELPNATPATGPPDAEGAAVEAAPEQQPPTDRRPNLMPMGDAMDHALREIAATTTPAPTADSPRFDMRIERRIRAQALRAVAGHATYRQRLEEVIARRDALLAEGTTPEPYASERDLLREIYW